MVGDSAATLWPVGPKKEAYRVSGRQGGNDLVAQKGLSCGRWAGKKKNDIWVEGQCGRDKNSKGRREEEGGGR